MDIDLIRIYNEGQKKWLFVYDDMLNHHQWISELPTNNFSATAYKISLEEFILDLGNKYKFLDTIFKNAEVESKFWDDMINKALCQWPDEVIFHTVSSNRCVTVKAEKDMLSGYKIRWSASQLKRGDV